MGLSTDEARRSKRTVTVGNVWRVSRRANLRLQLTVIGETHAGLLDLMREARGALGKHAKDDGTLDGLGLYRAVHDLEGLWTEWFKAWRARLLELVRAAAAVPFGAWASLHNEWFLPAYRALRKDERTVFGEHRTFGERTAFAEREASPDYVFNPQLEQVVRAAQARVYGDGLNLSSRLWKLDQQALAGIRRVLYQGVANGLSAWDMAKELEQYLGARAGCPRWTRTRLSKLTKADIAAGDPRGLHSNSPHSISSTPCDGVAGVAYNALRLARNEINAAHALATDYVFERMPWVEQEEVRLSPDHALKDECDAVAGVHPKGTVLLPIHPHCLCYKVAVLMKPDEFAAQLRGWMRGTRRWDAMDEYARNVGGELGRTLTASLFSALAVWAYGAAK